LKKNLVFDNEKKKTGINTIASDSTTHLSVIAHE